jgi:hypothetical protein
MINNNMVRDNTLEMKILKLKFNDFIFQSKDN